MGHVYSGTLVVLVCIAGYLFSYRSEVAGRHAQSLTLLVICGLILRMFVASDQFLHPWDERYHALVAKNLLAHPLKPTLYEHPLLPFRYQSWEYNHIWMHKQPVPLWLIAISLKLSGIHTWAVRVPSVLLSSVAVWLIFGVGTVMYGRKVGYVSAFLLSIHGLIIELAAGRTATDHVDVAFMFFVLLSVWCITRIWQGGGMRARSIFPYACLSGMSLGLAILSKWLPALIVLPVLAFLLLSRGIALRRAAACVATVVAVAACIVLPWQWYIMHQYPAETTWEYHFNAMHFTQVLADQGGSFFYHFDRLRMNYGELVYLPVIWVTWRGITRRSYADAAILTWFWIAYLFFSVCATKMQAYTLFAAPAVFLIIASCYYQFRHWAMQQQKLRWLYLAMAYGFVLLPIRYSIERTKPFQPMEAMPAWQASVSKLAASRYNSPNTVIFNAAFPLETIFATHCTAYPGYSAIPIPPAELGLIMDSATRQLLPDSAAARRLTARGYTLLRQTGSGYVSYFTGVPVL